EQQLALIETTPMEYELVRLQAQLQELTLSSNGLQFQERKLQAQLELIETNINRTINMLADNAVPANRLDELQTEAIILQTQLEGLDNQRSVFASKAAQLSAARATLQWQLQQASVRAPRDGVVLELLRHAGERVAAGMSLMTIGNPLLLEATIYLPLPDLPQVRLGDSAEVQCDGFDSNLPGIVSWIAEETEFTPKTIQTRETRTALVCAVRITVANPDGVLKAGMPVDVRLRNLMNDTQE
ncbi:MAG: HlyD family efflux transporter periplasmic adaptor subunit, partial [Candidatus Delongbacteria bacterium]|nr:HlyD family efflux transporter periplasmic adaptor subunit [Candidatus Delongbacteria bacterium]